jgi:hypothetical protein
MVDASLINSHGFNGEIMKRMLVYCAIALFLLASTIFAEEKNGKITLTDLPSAAQQSVQIFSKGAKLIGITKGDENGKLVYAVEAYRHGISQIAVMDEAGKTLEIEETSTLNKTPGQAKATIEKVAAEGKIINVNTITRNGVTSYKAVIKKDGKLSEIKVSAEGVIIK